MVWLRRRDSPEALWAIAMLHLASSLLVGACGRIGVELSRDLADDGLDGALGQADADASAPDRPAPDAAPALDPNEPTQASADNAVADVAPLDDPSNPPDAGCSAYTPFGKPEEITGLSVAGKAWGPALSADGLTLYFAENDDVDERIMMASRTGRQATFTAAVEVPNVQSSAFDGTPFPSFDGLSLLFFSSRAGSLGSRDLWIAERAHAAAPFTTPIQLADVNTNASDQLPKISTDGLTLIFTSNRAGMGENDVWVARRARASDVFGAPVNLAEVNSNSDDSSGTFSPDELEIFFASDRPGGLGGKDIWTATRSSPAEPFGAPVNLAALNSDTTDNDCTLSADGLELVFASFRGDVRRLWRSMRSCR